MWSLDAFRDYVKGKNVVLVSNSIEMMNFELGSYIDSFDVVVRFGRGLESWRHPRSLGTKCDVWCAGAMRLNSYKNIEKFDRENPGIDYFLFSRNRLNFKADIEYSKDWVPTDRLVTMFSDKELQNKNKKYNIDLSVRGQEDPRMSTGFICISFFVEKMQGYKSLNLVGFDFFSKEKNVDMNGFKEHHWSWHRPGVIRDTHIKAHDHELEASEVTKWAEQGLLKWHILTDLEKTEVEKTKFGNTFNLTRVSHGMKKRLKEARALREKK